MSSTAPDSPTIVAPASEFGVGSRKTLFHGDDSVLVVHTPNGLYAVQSSCPHAGATLEPGAITDDDAIICPFHAWCFDLKSGKLTTNSNAGQLKTYPIEIREGNVVLP